MKSDTCQSNSLEPTAINSSQYLVYQHSTLKSVEEIPCSDHMHIKALSSAKKSLMIAPGTSYFITKTNCVKSRSDEQNLLSEICPWSARTRFAFIVNQMSN